MDLILAKLGFYQKKCA